MDQNVKRDQPKSPVKITRENREPQIRQDDSDNSGQRIDQPPAEQPRSTKIHLSSIEKYILEWQDLSLISEDRKLSHLRKIAIDGHLKVSKFRSICWSLLLDVLHGNAHQWVQQRQKLRLSYAHLKEKFSPNPHTSNVQDDPLSQSEQSVWNQHFCDKELCAVIKQDVVRTFPGIDFYRKANIQEIMTNILFCYARENPNMCYRQGMHEILAPILFVMHSDHQTLRYMQDISANIDSTLQDVLNPKYIEEDTYFIFSKIMLHIESYYRINDMKPSSTGYFPSPPNENDCGTSGSKLEVIGQLNSIRDTILAKEDNVLHNYLLDLDIPLPIFGIRWLRLLFGREFPQEDLLVLWDAIFAEGNHFELTNFIVVSMLIRIRKKLLNSEYTTCLTYLMKYPANIDISLIIRHAMHIKSPQLYKNPLEGFALIDGTHLQQETKSATLPRQMSLSNPPSNVRVAARRHTHSHDETKVKLAEIAKQMAAEEQLKLKISNIQRNTAALAAMHIQAAQSQGELDAGVIDGFLEDSPEILKIQLQNAYTVMSISRLKLAQYLTVLRKNIPGNSVDEVHQAMDGIEELCSLLKTKYSNPYSQSVPVERAFEANEGASGDGVRKKDTSNIRHNVIKVPTSLPLHHQQTVAKPPKKRSQVEAKNEFIKNLQNESENYEIRPTDDDTFVVVTHMSQRNTSVDGSDSSDAETSKSCSSTIRKSRYEKPDDHLLSRKAAKILGNRKEVEMHEFMKRPQDLHNDSADDRHLILVPDADPSGERWHYENDN